jgi:hypothetical protein
MRRATLLLITALCLALGGDAKPLAASPADAHTIRCMHKKGKAKRACKARQSRHRRAHRRARDRRKQNKPAANAPGADASTTSAGPSTGAVTTWRAVGSLPLADADAAALVHPAAEQRPGNAAENAYRPTAAELDAFRNGQRDKYDRTALMYNRLTAYVTGGFTGTTDEILQWVAHKWGIPEDVVRAVAANESSWNMSQLGDRKSVADPLRYPLVSLVSGTSEVYQSLGIMQVKWTPQGLHPGTEPLRWRSTAFNADYWGSVIRYYYDGLCDWCGPGYGSGQAWASIGAWYNPSPWKSGSQTYQEHVQARLAQRPWAQPGF